MRARARLIAAYVDHIGFPVRTILDAGCGLGLLRSPLRRLLPGAEYTGLEFSEYLCGRFGWERGSLASFRPGVTYDLVICYDVMQYLGAREAERAIANMGRLCGGVLYFGALTRKDWRLNCDQRLTDRNVHLRSGAWYRERLARAFRQVGTGFWIPHVAPLVTWELEANR
jgi:predicted TPR repeat methyltransferase